MHETAIRALAQQETALEALRARVGTLLAAAALIASFLGGQAIARNGLTFWVADALAAFGTVVLLSVYVLVPKRLIFGIDIEAAYRILLPTSEDDRVTDRVLARVHHDLARLNEPTVARIGLAAKLAGGALLTEIGLLGAALA
jgi:hypothetical protein